MKRLEANFAWIILCLCNNLRHTHICWVMKCPSVPHRTMACNLLYVHGLTRDRFHMIAQCVMIWSVNGLYVQYSAHRMLLVFQEQHTCSFFATESVLFPVWQLKGWNNILPAISCSVNLFVWQPGLILGVLSLSFCSLSGLFVWRL